MLILQRRSGESVRIGEEIEVSVVSIDGGKVRLAISAPKDVTILRSELVKAFETNRESAMDQTAPADVLQMLEGFIPAASEGQQAAPLKALKPQEHKTENE